MLVREARCGLRLGIVFSARFERAGLSALTQNRFGGRLAQGEPHHRDGPGRVRSVSSDERAREWFYCAMLIVLWVAQGVTQLWPWARRL